MPHDNIATVKAIKNGNSLAKSAAILSVSLSLIMIGLKIYGWFITDSLSILSSLTDSLMDVLVSGLNLFAIYYALKPADEDHRYGHTAIEDIAGFFQAAMLTGTSLLILIEAVNRFISPVPASSQTDVGLYIMIICFGLTLGLVAYQQFVIRRSQSLVIKADSLHYLSDLLTTAAVIASLYFWKHFDMVWVDPLLSIVIVAVIAYGAFQIGKESFDNLMDKEMSDDDRAKIIAVLNEAKDKHKGYHDLRTRRSGHRVFIQLHLELDKNRTLYDMHEVAETLENKIGALFKDADVIIHQDPA